MKTQTYKDLNNNDVELNIANDQQHDRPFKYFCVDADFSADIATALNMKVARVEDLLIEVFKRGIKDLKVNDKALDIDSYNFGRKMKRNIRNVGTHDQQQALYKAMIEAPAETAKADKTSISKEDLNKDLLSYVATKIKEKVERATILKSIVDAGNSEKLAKAHLAFYPEVAPVVPTPALPTEIKVPL